MNFSLLVVAILALVFGSLIGYYVRQSIAKKQAGTLEQKLAKKIEEAKANIQKLHTEAKEKADKILGQVQKEEEERRKELFKAEQLLLKRENLLNEKSTNLDQKELEFQTKISEIKEIKENIETLRTKIIEGLERVSGLKKEEAKEELLKNIGKAYEQEVLDRLRKLEEEGEEKYKNRAKEIIATAIQKYSTSQAQDITTTTVSLPSDEIKGRIIGKEGRNIKTLEKLTGVEIIIDETPEAVVISGFDPIRRQTAKMALEKLIKDGRIQPARIEEVVEKVEQEIAGQVKEAGEAVCYDTEILGLDPRLVQLLGRLKFRTSYGQNVLLHSMEVSHLAGALAAEIGANVSVAKKAGLLHDIGKAMDHQVQGSHTDIGVKILEKFGVEKEVIIAMKSHHEEYPYESTEAVLVQTADAISGARPGARKDTLENYLKRLQELESIATSLPGVEKAWALQAGRELRVFVKPENIDDLGAKQMARDIANKIQQELKYPGEIKVSVIRETRVVEYAR